jgi:hypothetical protein
MAEGWYLQGVYLIGTCCDDPGVKPLMVGGGTSIDRRTTGGRDDCPRAGGCREKGGQIGDPMAIFV